MALISIILFAFAVLFIGVDQNHLEVAYEQKNALHQMTAQSAKEFAEFATAANQYVQSIGLPLTGAVLTVTDLKENNLLPSNFPVQTPFGQTLIADYVSDPSNSSVLNVVVHTTGIMESALLQKAGLRQSSEPVVQYDTAVLAQNQVPSTIVGSTGQFFGILNGSNLNNLGSSSTETMPSMINTIQPEVAEYVLAPDQYGYWLFNVSVYGFLGLQEYDVIGFNNDIDTWLGGFFAGGTNLGLSSQSLSISSLGFSINCPSIATNLSNITNGNSIYSNDTLYESFNNGNASQSATFCIPSYKGQVVPISPINQSQIFTSNFNLYSFNWNGQYMENPQSIHEWTSNSSFINPDDIVGLNNNLYATGGFIRSFNSAPNYPSNEALPMPMPNAIFAQGLAVSVSTPQNTIDTYQIEADTGSLFTGAGCNESLVDPWTLETAIYNVWATNDSNGQNLCGSQETFWADWHAVKNSTNLNDIPISQNYKAYGNNYTLNFNVSTPLVQ